MINEREYKYWITKNSKRMHCWVVVSKLTDILSHPDKEILYNGKPFDGELHLNEDSLQYVYIADLTRENLFTLLQDDKYYYIIRNKNDIEEAKSKGKSDSSSSDGSSSDDSSSDDEDSDDERLDLGTKPSSSRIDIFDSFKEAIVSLSSGERRRLGVQKQKKVKLRKRETEQLKNMISIDFINRSSSVQSKLFQMYISTSGETVDLSGFHLLGNKAVNGLPDDAMFNEVKTIVFYQNTRISDFSFLKHFPRLEIASFWFMIPLTDDSMDQLSGFRTLQSIEFHHCYRMTARSLLPLAEMPLLNKLIMENPAMSCQENTFTTVIKEEEWAKLENSSLEMLLINSDNLTLDFIDYMILHFLSLKLFIINHAVLSKLDDNIIPGYDEKDKIVFQSYEDKSSKIHAMKPIKIKNLLKNKYHQNPFSDSMLNMIKERSAGHYKMYTGYDA